MSAINGSSKPFNYSEFMSKCDKSGIHADAALNYYLEAHPDADIDKLNPDQIISSYNTEHRKVAALPVQSSFSMDSFVRQAEKNHVNPNVALNTYLDKNPGITDLSQVKPKQIVHLYKKAEPKSGDVTPEELIQIEEIEKAEKSPEVRLSQAAGLNHKDRQAIQRSLMQEWKKPIDLREFRTLNKQEEEREYGSGGVPTDMATTHEKTINNDLKLNPILASCCKQLKHIATKKETAIGRPLTIQEKISLATSYTNALTTRNGKVSFQTGQDLLTNGQSVSHFRGKVAMADDAIRQTGNCRFGTAIFIPLFDSILSSEDRNQFSYVKDETTPGHSWARIFLKNGERYDADPVFNRARRIK